MTPKQKAKELVGKFNDWTFDERHSQKNNVNYAKQCALICVDEMLDCNTTSVYWDEDFEYWKQVKQEIENL